jgi:hypothetical protein
MDHNPGAGWGDRARFLGFVAREALAQMGWPGALLAAAGAVVRWRRAPRHVSVFLLFGFLGSTLLLILLLGFDYDELHRNTFRVYPLIAWGVLALWAGFGLEHMAGSAAARGWLSRTAALGAAGIVLVAATLAAHLPDNDRHDDYWAEAYARAVLESLPRGARFYGNADTVNGPIAYVHRVLGVRPDITFVTGTALPLDGIVARPYALAPGPLEALIVHYVQQDARPMFYTNGFPQPFAQDDYGLYFGVDTRAAPGDYRAVASDRVRAYFDLLDAMPLPADPWEAMHYRLLRQDQCRWTVALAGGAVAGDPARLPSACRGLQGRLWLTEQALAAGKADRALIGRWLPRDPRLLSEAITRDEAERYRRWLRWLALPPTPEDGPGM